MLKTVFLTNDLESAISSQRQCWWNKLKLNNELQKLQSKFTKKRKLNKGEMKIIEIMKMNKIIPQIKAMEEVEHKTIEVIPKENYEILERLTHKSLEFYKFFDRRNQVKNTNEKLQNEESLKNTNHEKKVRNDVKKYINSNWNSSFESIRFNNYHKDKANFFTGKSSKTCNRNNHADETDAGVSNICDFSSLQYKKKSYDGLNCLKRRNNYRGRLVI